MEVGRRQLPTDSEIFENFMVTAKPEIVNSGAAVSCVKRFSGLSGKFMIVGLFHSSDTAKRGKANLIQETHCHTCRHTHTLPSMQSL